MISDYLEPYNYSDFEENSWGNQVFFPKNEKQFEAIDNCQIAFVGIPDFRGKSTNYENENAPDAIREELYKLKGNPFLKICDLGNIRSGATFKDSQYAVKTVVAELLEKELIVIILGGDQSLTYGLHLAYQEKNKMLNVVLVDEKFQLKSEYDEIGVDNYIYNIFTHSPNILFNLSLLGYQTYLVDEADLTLLKKMSFESYRLGRIKEDIKEVEPIVRDADLMALSIGALKFSDAPGVEDASPNGFYAEEACQIARYAGLSDRLTSFGIFDYLPSLDDRNVTAKTIAQIIWYFVIGIEQRKKDFPIDNENDFQQFIVTFKDHQEDLVFLKSKRSNRWWIKIPDIEMKYQNQRIFPCSYKDYQDALKNEIPDRWLMAFNKMV